MSFCLFIFGPSNQDNNGVEMAQYYYHCYYDRIRVQAMMVAVAFEAVVK